MAITPEGKVKKFIREYMRKNFEDIWIYAPPGGAFGNAGVPDFIFYWHGVMIMIEAKAGKNKATKLQLKHLTHINRHGGVAAIVTDTDISRMDAIKKKVLGLQIDPFV